MNRTDRLTAITEELRRAGSRGRTAARLAERFEVSVRTIKRDLAALQAAGVPLTANAGPGGGYLLSEAVTLAPVTFTEAQAVAVAAALAGTARTPFAADGRAALEKILDVMGLDARTRAERQARHVLARPPAQRASTPGDAGRVAAGPVIVGPGGVGRDGARPDGVRPDGVRPHGVHPDGPPRTPAVRVLEEGLRRRLLLTLDYVDAQGQLTTGRPVEPHLFAYTRATWYLVGWCRLRDAPRWFRCERVTRAELTTERVPERDTFAPFGVPPDAAPAR